MQDILIIGAGGHGSEVRAYVAELAGKADVRLLGFIDDGRAPGPWLETEILGGLTQLDALAAGFPQNTLGYITAVGENPTRSRIVRTIEGFGHRSLRAWTLRHPTVYVGSDVHIGNGTLLAPHVIITTQVHIGSHCIVNVKASISHDCMIGDFVNINPGATICGRVTIGDGGYIGAGAVVKDRIRIGRGTIVGAGAVVVRDLPDGVTAVGVPARVIKENNIDWLDI